MKLIKLLFNGIAWGCTICTFVLIAGSACVGDSFLAMTAESFTKQAVGSMIVGIGFTVPSLIYDKENLSMGMRTFIHMGTGFLIYFVIASYLHWIPVDFGFKMTALSILIALTSAFVIWFCFYLYNKKEAQKLNEKLSSKN